MSDIVTWSLIGIALMGLEMFGLQGIGILFTGFSAITVAFLIYLNPELSDNIGKQLVYFFFGTAGWAAVLWLPLKKFIRYGDNGDYSNIINTYATANTDMRKSIFGEVIWSGTRMRAMIDTECPDDFIADKTTVKVVSVIEGILYVTSNLRQEVAKK